jgi:hypothetical protein
MHGFWMAIAERAQGSWLHPTWWPFWDGGIPFEFTYAPLLPALMASLKLALGVPLDRAFQIITAAVYCLGPLTLFAAAYLFTRSAHGSFLAALIYSLTSPAQLLAPDLDGSINSVWAARRLAVVSMWDDTPHMLALMLLPLATVAMYLALTRTHAFYRIAAIVLASLMVYASAFGAMLMALVSLALLIALPPGERLRRARTILLIGLFSYALAAAFLPPSLLAAMRAAGGVGGPGTWLRLILAVAAITLFFYYVSRWTSSNVLRFLALLTFLVSAPPLVDFYLHQRILPQPERYKLEMDALIPLLLVFGLRSWFNRLPVGVRAVLLTAVLAVAGSQLVWYRTTANYLFRPTSLDQTVEARASQWVAQNLPGVRVAMPGSIAMWADTFGEIPQFAGGSWSIAYNRMQQVGWQAQLGASDSREQDANISLAWLKAFGVGAVGVSSLQSAEYWKGFKHPDKFEGLLPVLWRSDGVTLYRVPVERPSLAHVIPSSAVVRSPPRDPADIAPMKPYLDAIDDPALPAAPMTWEGRNRIHVHTTISPGQALSLQISFHRGWHATANGRRVLVQRDALHLTWLEPVCDGPCDVQLDYDGGREIRLSRYLSVTAFLGLLAWGARSWKTPLSWGNAQV